MGIRYDYSYYPVAVISCTSFLILYKKISPHVSEKYFPVYQQISKHRQIEWHTRVNSTVNAMLVSVLCLYVYIYDDQVSKDPVWGNSKVVNYSSAIVVGYMVSDSILMLKHYRAVGELCYVLHHGISIYAYTFAMTHGALPWFANYRLIAEFSTPLVNQRWFLDVLGYPRKSPLFIVNGILMAAIFFMARIVSIPPYWLKIYNLHGTAQCEDLGYVWYMLICMSTLLDIINVYWFYKIFQGACKAMRNSPDWEEWAKLNPCPVNLNQLSAVNPLNSININPLNAVNSFSLGNQVKSK